VLKEVERKAPPRHFVQDAQHAASPETDNRQPELNQREVTLKRCFDISDGELRFLRPRVYDVDSAIQDFERTQKEAKRHGAFRSMMETKENQENEKYVGCIMGPQSNRRFYWDLIGLGMVCYDVIMTPLGLIMNEIDWINGLGWTVNAFWTIDIGVNFVTGYAEHAKVIMDWKMIARRYISKWFLFDVIVILPDWVALILQQNESIADTLSALRLLKIIRMFRLMRLVKMQRVIGDAFSRIHSDVCLALVRIALVLLSILTSLHVIACFWYIVGKADGGWVSTLGVEDSAADGYLVSLHWALASMQGTLWSITPLKIQERLFSVIMLPILLVFTAFFIAYTTMMLQQSTEVMRSLAGKRATLRIVARHYDLPEDMCTRIKRFIEAEKSIRELRQRENQLLKELSPDLQLDLKMQFYGGMLAHQAFMKFLMSRNAHFVRHLCSVIKVQDFMAGELIFQPGDACTVARFVSAGSLQYVHDCHLDSPDYRRMGKTNNFFMSDSRQAIQLQSAELNVHALELGPNQCISEPVLWTLWEHCGELASLTVGSCALLESNSFEEVVKLYPMVMWLAVLYSRQFIIYLNKNLMSDIVEPPDVKTWEPEAVEAAAEEWADLPFEDELPSHCTTPVVTACVRLSQDVAANGLDENRPHHGFTVIVGNEEALASCGKAGFNPFQGHDVRIITNNGGTNTDAIETLRRNAFHTDGAIVVDGRSGRVVASSWFVGDIRLGGMDGGARSRSAKAVAQQAGGCYVIKCSEDSRGKLILHLGTYTRVFNSKLKADDRINTVHDSV